MEKLICNMCGRSFISEGDRNPDVVVICSVDMSDKIFCDGCGAYRKAKGAVRISNDFYSAEYCARCVGEDDEPTFWFEDMHDRSSF